MFEAYFLVLSLEGDQFDTWSGASEIANPAATTGQQENSFCCAHYHNVQCMLLRSEISWWVRSDIKTIAWNLLVKVFESSGKTRTARLWYGWMRCPSKGWHIWPSIFLWILCWCHHHPHPHHLATNSQSRCFITAFVPENHDIPCTPIYTLTPGMPRDMSLPYFPITL